jgi:hypothetical protein
VLENSIEEYRILLSSKAEVISEQLHHIHLLYSEIERLTAGKGAQEPSGNKVVRGKRSGGKSGVRPESVVSTPRESKRERGAG